MKITCVKCGHVNDQGQGTADESCPACRVIYAKARPAAAPRLSAEPRANGFAPSSRVMGSEAAGGDRDDYVRMLRAESQYPAFRALTGLGAFVAYAVAAVAVVGGVVAWRSAGSLGAAVIGLSLGCLIAVFAKAAKEASLMLADMSDATLRMAQRQEGSL